MGFTRFALDHLLGGEVVEVTLRGSAANVRLMDDVNFPAYRRHGRYRFIGGLADRSPVRLQVPRAGNWHLIVDMHGLLGEVESEVRVVPGTLLPPRQDPLPAIPGLLHRADPGERNLHSRLDVFIAHTEADRESVAAPLARTLASAGLSACFKDYEFQDEDELRRRVGHGLSRSRFGILVLSNHLLGRGFSPQSLDEVAFRGQDGAQILLPIWDNVLTRHVMALAPRLGNAVARGTALHSLDEIAEEIAEVLIVGW